MSKSVDAFRDEFAKALAETYSVCARHVGEDGLSVDHKQAAVEMSFNLLVEYIGRLPEGSRAAAVSAINRLLPEAVAEKAR